MRSCSRSRSLRLKCCAVKQIEALLIEAVNDPGQMLKERPPAVSDGGLLFRQGKGAAQFVIDENVMGEDIMVKIKTPVEKNLLMIAHSGIFRVFFEPGQHRGGGAVVLIHHIIVFTGGGQHPVVDI